MMADGVCSKCKKRMGWSGKRPPCPRCGHQEPIADQEYINEFKKFLKARAMEKRGHKGSDSAE